MLLLNVDVLVIIVLMMIKTSYVYYAAHLGYSAETVSAFSELEI